MNPISVPSCKPKRFSGKNLHAFSRLKQNRKAKLQNHPGKKTDVKSTYKAITMLQCKCENKMNIKLYFSSSDQICDIGMSSWDKAAQMKEKR